MIQPKTIVFIHGAFVTFHCWDAWVRFFADQGYHCIAPPWPLKDAEARALRTKHPDPDLADLRLSDVLQEYERVVQSLPTKPVLIGHSIGGLVVQLLLQKGAGDAGVAIHSAPPMGVLTTKLSFVKSGWKALLPTSAPYLMSLADWQYAFANGLTLEERQASYDQLLVPESRRVMRDLLTTATKIDFSKSHPPLLFTAGSNDHFIPSSLNRTNHRKYADLGSATDFKEFRGRTHFVLGQEGWREIAEYILEWLHTH